MDTSEKYIKMCSKAIEIQELRMHYRDWETQDFCLEIDENGCFDVESSSAENFELFRKSTKQEGVIWLPRQDQLQEIGLEVFKEHDLVPEFIEFFNEINLKYGFSFALGNEWDTLEKVWLTFVMKEKHNKIWNSETENWDKIK